MTYMNLNRYNPNDIDIINKRDRNNNFFHKDLWSLALHNHKGQYGSLLKFNHPEYIIGDSDDSSDEIDDAVDEKGQDFNILAIFGMASDAQQNQNNQSSKKSHQHINDNAEQISLMDELNMTQEERWLSGLVSGIGKGATTAWKGAKMGASVVSTGAKMSGKVASAGAKLGASVVKAGMEWVQGSNEESKRERKRESTPDDNENESKDDEISDQQLNNEETPKGKSIQEAVDDFSENESVETSDDDDNNNKIPDDQSEILVETSDDEDNDESVVEQPDMPVTGDNNQNKIDESVMNESDDDSDDAIVNFIDNIEFDDIDPKERRRTKNTKSKEMLYKLQKRFPNKKFVVKFNPKGYPAGWHCFVNGSKESFAYIPINKK